MTCAIYHWLTDSGYFIHAVFPGAAHIDARIDDRAADVLGRLPEATDVFAFHLNCTITERFPHERAALVRALGDRSVRVLNANATNISKRHVHRTCTRLGLPTLAASRDGDPDEMVIVKTDLNFGGDSEWALCDAERVALGIGRGSDVIWSPSGYRVLPRRDVDAAWWTDDRLVCERYVANARDRWYRAFVYLDRVALCELVNANPIKKVGESVVSRLWTDSTDEEVRRMMQDVACVAREVGLDVGTIDAVVDDLNRHYIIDVNSTPAYNHPIPGVIEYMRGP